MSGEYEFLKECGVFFVGTADKEGRPQMRPFGAVMEHEGKLFISTSEGKRVYAQMKEKSFCSAIGTEAGNEELDAHKRGGGRGEKQRDQGKNA